MAGIIWDSQPTPTALPVPGCHLTPHPQGGEGSLAGRGSVVESPDGGERGGHAAGEGLGGLPVVLWPGLEQGEDVLQGARRLEAQGIHHVVQVLWRRRRQSRINTPDINTLDYSNLGFRSSAMLEPNF